MRTRGMGMPHHFFGSSFSTLFAGQARAGAAASSASASRLITLSHHFTVFPEEPAREDILSMLQAGDQMLDDFLLDYPSLAERMRVLRSKVLFTVNASPEVVVRQGGFLSAGKACVYEQAPDKVQWALRFAENPATALLIHQPNEAPHHQHLYAVAVNRRVIAGPEGVIYIPGCLGLSWWRSARIEKIAPDPQGQPVATLGRMEGLNNGPQPILDQHFEQFCQQTLPLTIHKERDELQRRPGRY